MNLHRKFSFCTLCLSKEHHLLHVFDKNETDIKLPVIIRELLHFEVLQGGCIPWKICSNCFMKLKDFQQFKMHATKCKEYLESTLLPDSRPLHIPFHVPLSLENGLPESHPTQTDTPILKPVEVFVNVDAAVERGEMTEEERDPLGGEDMDVKPPALILTLDQGVSREEDSASCPLPTGNAFAFGGVKQEIGDDATRTSARTRAESSPKWKSSNVTVSCADVVGAAVDGGGEGVGGYQETIKEEENADRLTATGHHSLLSLHQGMSMPVATHSIWKERRLRKTKEEGIESTQCSTAGRQFGEECGERTQRREKTRSESKQDNGGLAGNISIGSVVADEKSEGQDFMCDECGEVFRSKHLIERHVRVSCGTKVLDCGICNMKFQSRNDYRRHRSLHCGSNVSSGREQRGVAVDVSAVSEDKRQIKERIQPTCHICSKEFSHVIAMKVHIKAVHLKERNFSCGICGKAFAQKVTLQSHLRYHYGVKPYKCSHCEKGFTQSGDLRKHIRAVHKMEEPHTCGECGKAFSLKKDLKRHVLLHTGERTHTCDICSRSFSRKDNLESHMLIHTGEKPHTCTLCSKTFRQNGHLKRHMAIHSKNVPHP